MIKTMMITTHGFKQLLVSLRKQFVSTVGLQIFDHTPPMCHSSENCMILASAVLSQYTRVSDDDNRRRQTTSYANSGTCNAIATFR